MTTGDLGAGPDTGDVGAELGAAPAPLVVNPDPQQWSLIESMEIRREFGYAADQWQDALADSPELVLIGSAWLALRRHEPGITWKEAGERITLGQLEDLPKAPAPNRATRRRAQRR